MRRQQSGDTGPIVAIGRRAAVPSDALQLVDHRRGMRTGYSAACGFGFSHCLDAAGGDRVGGGARESERNAVPDLPAGVQPVSSQLPISGSALGFADDEGPTASVPPTATRVSFASPTPFSGLILTGDIANGTIDGPVSFTRDGATTICAGGTTQWFMSRFIFS